MAKKTQTKLVACGSVVLGSKIFIQGETLPADLDEGEALWLIENGAADEVEVEVSAETKAAPAADAKDQAPV